ncbi:hypothetical protein MKEN_00856100 [Mycena kentingensis (nom. inval.)]|nr:hypothetical protein MKEN_00856100 [Mycena kentingensis (nom. inval.)]
MSHYNRTRHAEALLAKHAGSPPSLVVHLHAEHWMLNHVSKFSYSTPISSLLDDIRAHRIPVDFLDVFDSAKVPFYEGCMLVELLDYRQQQQKEPERTRVVLYPNSETLFADICALNRKNGEKWTDRDALEVEAKILLATAPPLCLVPDPHLTRVVNHVMRVSTPTVPNSLKRKAAVMNPEEDEVEKARKMKVMQFMAPRPGRTHAQNYRILDTIHRFKQASGSKPPTPIVPTPAPPSTAPSSTPVPHPAVQKIATSTRSSSPHNSANHTPSPTHMYGNPQGSEAKRAPTPLQQQYNAPPPQPPVPQPIAQLQQPPQATHTPRPPSVTPNGFQPTIPNAHFLNQPPPPRNANGDQGQPKQPPQPIANGQQVGTPKMMAAAMTRAQKEYAQSIATAHARQGIPPSSSPGPAAGQPQQNPAHMMDVRTRQMAFQRMQQQQMAAQQMQQQQQMARARIASSGSPANNATMGVNGMPQNAYMISQQRAAAAAAGSPNAQAAAAALAHRSSPAPGSRPGPSPANGARPGEGGPPMPGSSLAPGPAGPGQPQPNGAAAHPLMGNREFLAYQAMRQQQAQAHANGQPFPTASLAWQQQMAQAAAASGRPMPMPNTANAHQMHQLMAMKQQMHQQQQQQLHQQQQQQAAHAAKMQGQGQGVPGR